MAVEMERMFKKNQDLIRQQPKLELVSKGKEFFLVIFTNAMKCCDRMSAILFVLLTTSISFYYILLAKYGEPDLDVDRPYY